MGSCAYGAAILVTGIVWIGSLAQSAALRPTRENERETVKEIAGTLDHATDVALSDDVAGHHHVVAEEMDRSSSEA
jgi:hypothetical protein